ncbi:MAG: HAMP domain-containing sensor histidine kinase [Ignavibacteriaceae bacterium]
MRKNRFIENYKKIVFGNDSSFQVQKNVFLLITHISIIIGIVGVIVDIVLDLGFFLTAVTLLTVIFLIIFHIKVRNSNLTIKYSLSFFIISILVLPFLWFYNGGYDGNNIILIFVYFIVILTILPSNFRFTAFILYGIMITSLTIVNYNYPHLVIAYESDYARIIDLLLGYILYLILAFNIQNIILKNYETDRLKINDQNNQLNSLIEKLNDTNSKLQNTIKNVEELNISKDRFITILSHDLRSPFQGLLGITKILESNFNSFSDNEKQYYISQINSTLNKLYSFLEQLLLWGKIQKNGLILNYEICNIKDLISESLSPLTISAEKKKISIELVCDKELVAAVDKERISIVLRNLISNAIKFSPVGSKVSIYGNEVNDDLIMAVVDEGVGISEEYINKLFKLDEIISSIGTDGELGSGMGLILCNDILKKHSGKIIVDSKEGKGSTFTITLPKINQ